MDIWKKLKDFISAKCPELKNLITVNITINSNNYSNKIVEYTEPSNTAKCNIKKLDGEQKKEFYSLLKMAQEDGAIFIEDRAKKRIEDIQSKNGQPHNQRLLKILKTLVPSEDIIIWEAALYLNELFKKGEKIGMFKLDIMKKYGERGKNIVNLCTAGYIEEYLIPFYDGIWKETKEPAEVKEKFRKVYFYIVDELPFTIFVSSQMNKSTIIDKVMKRFKYGVRFINIHGIGKDNVKKINDVISELEEDLTLSAWGNKCAYVW